MSTAFIQRDFGVITEKLATYIYDHLFACNQIEKAYSQEGEPTHSKYSFSQTALIFFFKDIYPEIPHLLKALTIIEEGCLKQNKLPLWRHSYQVQPAPLMRVNDTVHSRTRSFSYSFLSCIINDGTFSPIGNSKGNKSACTFSYYAQMLRDRAFVKKEKSKFPYYIPGQVMKSEEEIKEVLASIHDDNITCTLLDKSQLNHDAWYLPKVFANNVIWLSGKEYHPRLKGTWLSPNEEMTQYMHMGMNIFQTTIPAKTSAKIFQKSPVIWVTHEGVLLSSEDGELIARLEEQRLLDVAEDID